jgi:D-alanyl-D-alanine carboxypeptidase
MKQDRHQRALFAAVVSTALQWSAACGSGHEPPPETLASKASAVLTTHEDRHEFVGSVMAVEAPAFGSALVSAGSERLNEPSAVDPSVPWLIGSATKTFVAVVVLQLAQEHALDLDAGVASFLPDLPRADEITPRRLLQHRSGLNEYFDSTPVMADPTHGWTPAELIQVALERGPLDEPGRAHHYSNTNYIALGEIVRAVTGRRWYQEVHARIVDPLGLSHTHYVGEPGCPKAGPGFVREADEFEEFTLPVSPELGGAAGGLQSTASDLLRFTQALQDGELLNPEQREAMELFVPADPIEGVGHGYGLGLEMYEIGGLVLQGHVGTAFAHTSFIGFEPQSGVRVAALINAFEPATPVSMAAELIGELAQAQP